MDNINRKAELNRGILEVKAAQVHYVQSKTPKARLLVANEIVSHLRNSIVCNSDLIDDFDTADKFSRALEIWEAICIDLKQHLPN